MEMLFRIALSNAAAAAVLALVALLAALVIRKPALTHGLWLLVLLKLVSPPLWMVPLHFPVPAAEPPSSPVGENTSQSLSGTDLPIGTEREIASKTDVIPIESHPPETAEPPRGAENKPSTTAREAHYGRIDLRQWLAPATVVLWLSGTAICACLGIGRIVQFRRMTLRFAEPAPAGLQRQARILASRLELPTCPQVLLIPGALSPMLWAAGGGARVLVPRQLLDRLDDYQRATLLAHELAHLRRGDHWVRYLELLVTCLYWWYPVCWWARRAIREAGEQCCDAWVLWAIPGAFRSYATALLDTIEFLSGPGSSVPALASGLGQFRQLKRRLIMLKRGSVSKALTWSGFFGLCGAAALLLPLAPTWAQQAEKPSEEQVEQQQARAEEQTEKSQAEREAQAEKAEAKREAAQERAQAEVEKRQAEADALGQRAREQAEQAVNAAQEQVGNVLARAKEAIAQAAQRDDNENDNDNSDRGRGRNRDELRQAVKEAQQQVERAVEMAKRQVAQAIREASRALGDAQKQARDAQREATRSRQERGGADADLRRQLEDAHRQIRDLSQKLAQSEQRFREDARRGRGAGRDARPDGPAQDPNVSPSNRDERLSRLEKQLSALMDEVKSLEQNRDQPARR